MNRPLFIFLTTALTVAAAGCAEFHAKPISPAGTAAAFEARTLPSPGLQKFIEANLPGQAKPWPPRSWDLKMLTLVAIYYSPDLDLARAQWQVAEAGKITAGQHPNPSISMRPGFIGNPGMSNPLLFGIVPNIPIETAGKRGYRLARAGHLARAAYLEIVSAAWQVRSRLRTALLDLYLSRESAALHKRQMAVQEDLAEVLAARLAQGEIPRPELTQAEISRDQARLLWQEAQRQMAENRVRLAAALGVPVSALQQVKISYGFLKRLPAAPLLKELKGLALLSRPDILASLARYEAAQSALQLEIAKQYPDLNLGPGYSFDDSENKWSFRIALTLPVLNQNQGPIAEAEARRKEAAARFEELQARIIGDVDRAGAAYAGARRQLTTAAGLDREKEKQWRAVEAGFQAGQVDRLALLRGQKDYLSLEFAHLEALIQAQQALGVLEATLYRPLDAGDSFPAPVEADPRGKGRNHK